MAFLVLRPSTTVTAQWTFSDASLVDESVFYPDSGDQSYVVASKHNDEGDVQYGFTVPTGNMDLSTQYTFFNCYFLGRKLNGAVQNPDFSLVFNDGTFTPFQEVNLNVHDSLDSWTSNLIYSGVTLSKINEMNLLIRAHSIPESGTGFSLPGGSGILLDSIYILCYTSSVLYKDETTLYIGGNPSITDQGKLPLYLDGEQNYSNEINLYIEGSSPSSIMPLYIRSDLGNTNNNLNLYINNVYDGASLDLYIHNSGIEHSLPLYLHYPKDSGNSNISLFIKNTENPWESNTVPLLIQGTQLLNNSSNIPLTLYNNLPSVSSNVPFFIDGDSALSLRTTLFTKGLGPSSTLPLFLKGPTYVEQTSTFPLYIRSEPTNISGTTPLYIANSGVFNTCNLYVDGRYKTNNNMNLFLSVQDNIEEHTTNLYIEGKIPSSGTLTLHTLSEVTSSVDLSIPYVKDTGTYTNTFDLYISGRRGTS